MSLKSGVDGDLLRATTLYKRFNFACLYSFAYNYNYVGWRGSVVACTYSLCSDGIVCICIAWEGLSLYVYYLCSSAYNSSKKIVSVLSRNCMIFESTPTPTFWLTYSAIWVGVLSSEYGISEVTERRAFSIKSGLQATRKKSFSNT